jgi:general secretion pathway protein L
MMQAGDVGLRPGEWLGRIGWGWRWWTGELAQLVPAAIREAFSTIGDALFIDAHETEFVVFRQNGSRLYTIARIPRDEFAVRTLRLSIPHESGLRSLFADPVILRLPAREALVRTLRLPATARRNLGAILRHEVVRQSPIAAEDIYYDYRVAGETETDLPVELRIVRREPVDTVSALCREAGIALAAVEFDDDTARPTGGTFPADLAAARTLKLRPRIVPALAGIVFVLALAFIGAVYLRGEMIAGDLSDRVDQARERAVAVERLQRSLDATNRQASFLALQKRNPAAVAVLATLSRLLPDDAWLYQFEMNGDEVRVHGFSASAASLIALLDSSPYFREAEFRSPLMQGPSAALQRFDIAFKLKAAP